MIRLVEIHLARDGRVWTANTGEDQIDWIANEGIRVAALVKHWKEVADLPDLQRRLLNSALAGLASQLDADATTSSDAAKVRLLAGVLRAL